MLIARFGRLFGRKAIENLRGIREAGPQSTAGAPAEPAHLRLSEGFGGENEPLRVGFLKGMTVYEDFLSETDEGALLKEIEPYMKRLRYEFDHWDDAIHGFRETERMEWNLDNTRILDRVRTLAFPQHVNPLAHVHILDLDVKGYIKPHIDAVRYCGDTIAGLSLLSDSVMRMVHEKKKELFCDILLKRRSLYIMKDAARYDYTHEILRNEASTFDGRAVEKTRRISVICRNQPNEDDAVA